MDIVLIVENINTRNTEIYFRLTQSANLIVLTYTE